MQQAQSISKIFPRYKRASGKKPGFTIQPRDLEIIKLVHDYRFLNSDQIKYLVTGSNQVILRRLQKLFHHGFLDRPLQQFSYRGNHKMIYALGNSGATILASEYGMDRRRINWRNKNYEAGEIYLNHTLMISHFRVALSLALQNVDNTELLFWKQDATENLKDYVIVKEHHKLKQRIPICPDAFFGIVDFNGIKKYFFLEADQSTMTNARFFKKMKGYFNYWKQKKFAERFNIANFRILTLTKSQQRADNLRRVARKADEKQKGFAGFLFSSEKSYNIEHPLTLLKPIWRTPVNDEYHCLLE
jgi:hypothetical protein